MRPLCGAVLAALIVILTAGHAWASGVQLIRDAEIETTIRTMATPLFEAAGLNPRDVRIVLVKDHRLNAFVAGGMNVYIHTGLIQNSDDPTQLMGVIAHEAGHIAGGHLVRVRDAIGSAMTQSILGMVLGTAAAILTGEPGAGHAIMQGSQQMVQREFFSYSRQQESMADQAALTFLERARISPLGLMEFLGKLSDQELLTVGQQDPYMRTHPVTLERVETIRAYLERNEHKFLPPSAEMLRAHARMLAKLDGFLEPTGAVLAKYRADDRGEAARYARAIAYYRLPDLGKALPLIDDLIADFPDDPYYHELKGQMLYENGKAAEAIPSYRRAHELLPESALIRQELAVAALAMEDTDHTREAIGLLNRVVQEEPRNAGAWRWLGIAYGRDGEMGLASLALAESAAIRGHRKEARMQAERAQRGLDSGSGPWLRAEDIKRLMDQNEKDDG